MTLMFLEPFTNHSDRGRYVASQVSILLHACQGNLRRLFIDFGFLSLHPRNDHEDMHKMLRDGLERLIHLEQFVGLSGDLVELSLLYLGRLEADAPHRSDVDSQVRGSIQWF